MLDCPAALTGALDQFGCHHKCSSTVDSHHSLLWCHVLLSLRECCFFLSVIVLCVYKICHACMYLSVGALVEVSAISVDCPAALTGALDQFGCHHKCSSTVDSHHSLLWCHVLLSLRECCFFLSVIVLCVYKICHACMYLSVGALVEVSAISVGLSSCSHGCSGPVWLPSQVL